MGVKICHITSVHDSADVRIFVKECSTLAAQGYDTFLVTKGKSRVENGVNVVGIDCNETSRFSRMFSFARKIYKKALALNCDIYHLHDPELLPFGLKLKNKGKTVIFDSHEDVKAQIMDKYWIPKFLRKSVAYFYAKYQAFAISRIDAVIAATPHIKLCLEKDAKQIAVVNNYPRLEEITVSAIPFSERDKIIGYAGSLDRNRGLDVIKNAMSKVDGKLLFASKETIEGCTNIENCGILNRKAVNELYGKSRIGVVLYQPAANHFDAQPIKMFEYMAAGIPFVASNFVYWKEIVDKNKCGLCVNPTDSDKIAEACNILLNNPTMCAELGKNGRLAAEKFYNWNIEKTALLNVYEKLLKSKGENKESVDE